MSRRMIHKRRICIVEYSPEEYTRHYIVQALFRLMSEYEYEKIKVTDVALKAGVGRATFYRYFKTKNEVLIYYFEHYRKEFEFARRFYPRCKEDYVAVAESVFTMFKEHKDAFVLIRKARLEYIYLDYLNRQFAKMFLREGREGSDYLPYIYAGMLFNISMGWLDNGCAEPPAALAETVVNAIYFK